MYDWMKNDSPIVNEANLKNISTKPQQIRKMHEHESCIFVGFQCIWKESTHVYITMRSLWARWHIKLPGSRLFTQQFIQCADQRKHQSSTSLVFVRGIHRWPVNSPNKGPVTRKMFPINDGIMYDINIQSFIVCYGFERLSMLDSYRPLYKTITTQTTMNSVYTTRGIYWRLGHLWPISLRQAIQKYIS